MGGPSHWLQGSLSLSLSSHDVSKHLMDFKNLHPMHISELENILLEMTKRKSFLPAMSLKKLHRSKPESLG